VPVGVLKPDEDRHLFQTKCSTVILVKVKRACITWTKSGLEQLDVKSWRPFSENDSSIVSQEIPFPFPGAGDIFREALKCLELEGTC
jgi:hypothetical protein